MAESKCLVSAEDFRIHFEGKAPSAPKPPAPAPTKVFAGWTFGGFIEACQRKGLRFNDPLAAIDFGTGAGGTRCIDVEMDDDLRGFVVREER